MEHRAALLEVAVDPELWRWTGANIENGDDLKRYMQYALDEQKQGSALPFVTISKTAKKPVGSTRFGNIDARNRHVEIGWTWIGRPWQRTALNTEAKLLMLRHAFEVLGCLRVELRTDVLNQQSRAAISRLGAKEEGVMRKHLITERGRVRDTVYYSIIDDEWPAVKARLEARLRQDTH
jgi:RimJ/RimL family protein N-acetyltransferase